MAGVHEVRQVRPCRRGELATTTVDVDLELVVVHGPSAPEWPRPLCGQAITQIYGLTRLVVHTVDRVVVDVSVT